MWFKWFVFALVSLAAKVINYFLAPFVVPFASADGWLPNWLSWFQTPDNSLDGDGGWRNEHMPFKNERNKFQRWVNRTGWLRRNSMYGFKIDVLGFDLNEPFNYLYRGNQNVSDRPYAPGWVYRAINTMDGRETFQFYLILPTFPGKCLRVMAGWKLWQHPKRGDKLQLGLSFNPIKSRG